jgi:hypothetical protein
MLQATTEKVATIYATGRGSDYFGACEVCNKHCAEHSVYSTYRVYADRDGARYLSGVSAGMYGHRDCLLDKLGQAFDRETLERSGRMFLAPPALEGMTRIGGRNVN